jgi:hypothetical protein
MRSTLALLLIIAAPPAGGAQRVAPDSSITRLAWSTVNVLVRADTISSSRQNRLLRTRPSRSKHRH